VYAGLLCTIALAVVSVAQTPTPTPNEQLVKVEYDASKNFTQISLNPIVLASRKLEELRLAATSGYPGKTRTKPTEITLIIFSLSHTDENRYGATHKLSAVADGHRFDWERNKPRKTGREWIVYRGYDGECPNG
jgi:hypothetical protein